jgi:hypothetical protein
MPSLMAQRGWGQSEGATGKGALLLEKKLISKNWNREN